jgi:hypothetical protein
MRRRIEFMCAATLVGLALTRPARAQQARFHDGLYLRLGAGFAYGSDSIESDTIPFFGKAKGTVTGFGGSFQAVVGGSPIPGLALGGGYFLLWVPSPSADEYTVVNIIGSNIVRSKVTIDTALLHLVAPVIDFYVNPEGGLHFMGAPGYAAVSAGELKTDTFTSTGFGGGGFGFLVGAGYEWWVADAWGVGVLGQMTFAWLSGEDDAGYNWTHHIISPAVLFTATMN